MQTLLKFYLIDLLKKIALTVLVTGLIFGFILYPLASSGAERLLFVYLSFSIALYGLYFYTFPLIQVSKWLPNAPLSRTSLIGFNIIFQTFKIIILLSIFFFVMLLAKRLMPIDGPLSDSPLSLFSGRENDLHYVKLVLENKSTYIEELFSTQMIMLNFLLLAFLFTFLFNVDPYGPFKNRQGQSSFIQWFTFKLKLLRTMNFKSKKVILLTAALTFSIAFIRPSKAALGALGVYICFWVFIKTHDRHLIFSKKNLYAIQFSLLATTLFCWLNLHLYSLNRSENENLSLNARLMELEFQAHPLSKKHVDAIVEKLKLPTTCDFDFAKYMHYLKNADVLKVYRQLTPLNPSQTASSFGLGFAELFSPGEKGLCGLMQRFETLDPKLLSSKQWNTIFLTLENSQNEKSYSSLHADFEKLLQAFANSKQSDQNLREMLQSQKQILTIVALSYISKHNLSHFAAIIKKSIHTYHTKSLLMALSFLAKTDCIEYRLGDLDKITTTSTVPGRSPASACATLDKIRRL